MSSILSGLFGGSSSGGGTPPSSSSSSSSSSSGGGSSSSRFATISSHELEKAHSGVTLLINNCRKFMKTLNEYNSDITDLQMELKNEILDIENVIAATLSKEMKALSFFKKMVTDLADFFANAEVKIFTEIKNMTDTMNTLTLSLQTLSEDLDVGKARAAIATIDPVLLKLDSDIAAIEALITAEKTKLVTLQTTLETEAKTHKFGEKMIESAVSKSSKVMSEIDAGLVNVKSLRSDLESQKKTFESLRSL